MSAVREPQVSLSIIPAEQSATDAAQRVLFVGQMLSGSATAGTLVENIGVAGEEDGLFGARSLIAGMVRAARKLNKVVRFDALPLADNGSGVAATGSIVFTGTATAAGALYVSIGSAQNYRYEVDVSIGDTAAVVAGRLTTLIGADTRVPVTAALSTATVNITAANKGTIGNTIGFKVDGTVAGIGITVNAMASGATDPSLTTAFDPVTDIRYQSIVWPSKFDNTKPTGFLEPRFNVNNNVLDGEAFICVTDTYSNHITALAALNKKTLTYFPNKAVNDTYYKGSAIFELNDEISSQFAAIRSLRFSNGADISQFVVGGGGALDAFGGMAIASLPYHNTPLPNLPVIPTNRGFTSTEMTALVANGGAILGNNPPNTQIICGRVVSTYKTDSAGNPDVSFTFLEYIDTLSVIREYYVVNFREAYPQFRLTTGIPVANRRMASPLSISALCTKLYNDLSDLALTQKGEAALKYYKQNLTISVDMTVGSVTILMNVPIVVQLRQIIGTIQLAFVDLS